MSVYVANTNKIEEIFSPPRSRIPSPEMVVNKTPPKNCLTFIKNSGLNFIKNSGLNSIDILGVTFLEAWGKYAEKIKDLCGDKLEFLWGYY